MKRTISFIILALVTLCSVFAGSRELKLTHTEKAYTNFDFLYDGSLLTEDDNNEKPVTLTDRESKPIIVRWNYNIGPTALGNEYTGISINFTTEGFKHTAEGVNDKVAVRFKVEPNENYSDLYNSILVSNANDQQNFGLLGIHPKTNMRGTADIATVTVIWDDHPWLAGEYRCDIKISFYGE